MGFAFFAAFFTFGLSFSGLCGVFNAKRGFKAGLRFFFAVFFFLARGHRCHAP